MDIKDFITAIEPLQATTANASPEEDLQLMSLTSLAISAKRSADALELIAKRARREARLRGLNNLVEELIAGRVR